MAVVQLARRKVLTWSESMNLDMDTFNLVFEVEMEITKTENRELERASR